MKGLGAFSNDYGNTVAKTSPKNRIRVVSNFIALIPSLNFIRLLRVVITPSVTSMLRGENDSRQSDEIQDILFQLFQFVIGW